MYNKKHHEDVEKRKICAEWTWLAKNTGGNCPDYLGELVKTFYKNVSECRRFSQLSFKERSFYVQKDKIHSSLGGCYNCFNLVFRIRIRWIRYWPPWVRIHNYEVIYLLPI
jgi:hypothetical protein